MSDTERFSLKDHLFNEVKVKKMAKDIKAAYPVFDERGFVHVVVAEFPQLELMQRIAHISTMLRAYLPEDYLEALSVLVASLPPPCDPSLSDDDFGEFIYAPYGHFVSEYGCEKQYLKESLAAIKEITQRFSCEWAIRRYLNEFPKETLAELKKWTKDSHYHVRRLVSEGTRPNLPWAKKVTIIHSDTLPLLELLYTDKTRFVTRSVANHLNDIAKTESALVVRTLVRWQESRKQSESEMKFMLKHSLRTLVKQGNKEALALLGHGSTKVTLESFAVETPKVKIGEALMFSCVLQSTDKTPQDFVVDYIIDFKKANGSHAQKVHKLKMVQLKPKEKVTLVKKHPLRLMTTRTLYPGEHKVTLQVNGKVFDTHSFLLY
jgi:3-methyladenine DNA glycosylase AlkC